jgi:hypothetical protein
MRASASRKLASAAMVFTGGAPGHGSQALDTAISDRRLSARSAPTNASTNELAGAAAFG